MSEPDPPIVTSSAIPTAPARNGGPVCPHCMVPIGPLEDFCHKCGRPITALAAMDPFKQVFAQGHVFREAASRPRSFLVVVGMWLLFGPALLGMSLVLRPGHLSRALFGTESSVEAYLGLILSLGLMALYAALLYRVTVNYLHNRNIGSGQCAECGYDLTGLPEPRCPECSAPFDPQEVYSEPDEDVTGEAEDPLEPGASDENPVAVGAAPSSDESSRGPRGSWPVGIPIFIALACGVIAYKNPEGSGVIPAVIAVVCLLMSGFFLHLADRQPPGRALDRTEDSDRRSGGPRTLADPGCPERGEADDPSGHRASAEGREVQPVGSAGQDGSETSDANDSRADRTPDLPPSPGGRTLLCRYCAAPNAAHLEWCVSCGRPLAAYDAFRHLYGSGEASAPPGRPQIQVALPVGLWVLAGWTVVGLVALVLDHQYTESSVPHPYLYAGLSRC